MPATEIIASTSCHRAAARSTPADSQAAAKPARCLVLRKSRTLARAEVTLSKLQEAWPQPCPPHASKVRDMRWHPSLQRLSFQRIQQHCLGRLYAPAPTPRPMPRAQMTARATYASWPPRYLAVLRAPCSAAANVRCAINSRCGCGAVGLARSVILTLKHHWIRLSQYDRRAC